MFINLQVLICINIFNSSISDFRSRCLVAKLFHQREVSIFPRQYLFIWNQSFYNSPELNFKMTKTFPFKVITRGKSSNLSIPSSKISRKFLILCRTKVLNILIYQFNIFFAKYIVRNNCNNTVKLL